MNDVNLHIVGLAVERNNMLHLIDKKISEIDSLLYTTKIKNLDISVYRILRKMPLLFDWSSTDPSFRHMVGSILLKQVAIYSTAESYDTNICMQKLQLVIARSKGDPRNNVEEEFIKLARELDAKIAQMDEKIDNITGVSSVKGELLKLRAEVSNITKKSQVFTINKKINNVIEAAMFKAKKFKVKEDISVFDKKNINQITSRIKEVTYLLQSVVIQLQPVNESDENNDVNDEIFEEHSIDEEFIDKEEMKSKIINEINYENEKFNITPRDVRDACDVINPRNEKINFKFSIDD